MDHWWVPGLTIGYEHTFVHAIADLLNGVETGTPASRPSAPRSRRSRCATRSSSRPNPASGSTPAPQADLKTVRRRPIRISSSSGLRGRARAPHWGYIREIAMPADAVVRARIDTATERAAVALAAMGTVDFRRHPTPDACRDRRRATAALRGQGPGNAATRRAMAELEQGKGKRFESAEAMLEDLGICKMPRIRFVPGNSAAMSSVPKDVASGSFGCRELHSPRAAYPARVGSGPGAPWG